MRRSSGRTANPLEVIHANRAGRRNKQRALSARFHGRLSSCSFRRGRDIRRRAHLSAPTSFFAGAFFAAAVFVADYFATTFSLFAALESVAALPPSIKNLDRSFTEASHSGARPRPLQVAPDFGSRYLAGCGPRT